MAADAPGIQIGAINPRKATLESQPNVSRPAITRSVNCPRCATLKQPLSFSFDLTNLDLGYGPT